jgi:two-component system LytT family response regulator
MKIKAVFIDDEIGARETISQLIKLYCPNVELIAEAASVQEGVKVLSVTEPDVLLLDIRMNDGTGFDLLDQFPDLECQIVFVTAYDQYALQALKCSALDYLLKPIDPDELAAAFEKAAKAIDQNQQRLKLNTLKDNFNRDARKVILTTHDSIYVVNVDDIIRCEATGNYTQFYLTSNRKLLVSKTLKEYEELLHPYHFYRLHHSHLINLQHLERYNKKDGGSIIMSDQSAVPVSLRRKEQLLQLLKAIN